MNILSPKRSKHSYIQSLATSPQTVFPLLCPVREAEWVPDWNPELVVSHSGVAEVDCVFVTPGSPESSIWVITHHDPENYQLEMIKVTPNHTVAKLEIELADDGHQGTSATIAYTYTSLSPQGDAFLETFTEDWYQDFMRGWEQALNHYLATGRKLNG